MQSQCKYTRATCPYLRNGHCNKFHPSVEEVQISSAQTSARPKWKVTNPQQNSMKQSEEQKQKTQPQANKFQRLNKDALDGLSQLQSNSSINSFSHQSKPYQPRSKQQSQQTNQMPLTSQNLQNQLMDLNNSYISAISHQQSNYGRQQKKNLQQNVTSQLNMSAISSLQPQARQQQDADTMSTMSLLDQLNISADQSKRRPNNRACKFGVNCRDHRVGRCTYLHDVALVQPQNSFPRQNHAPSYQNFVGEPRQLPQQNLARANDRPFDEAHTTPHHHREPAARDSQQRESFFSKAILEKLADKELNEIKLDFHSQGPKLRERLDGTKLDDDLVYYLIKILSKLIDDKDAQISTSLISVFVESKFMSKLKEFISINIMKALSQVNRKVEYCLACIKVMSNLLDMFPSRVNQFPVIELALEVSLLQSNPRLTQAQRQQLMKENELLKAKHLLTINDQRDEQEEESKQKKASKQIKQDDSYKRMPEHDFKLVDVIPGERELRQKRSEAIQLLRRMPEKGDLVDKHNYLDIVFRLLYEDAVADLRGGIELVASIDRTRINKQEFRNCLRNAQIKLHERLTIDSLQVMDGTTVIQFRLPTNKARFLDWRISKKLLPGSLVILSPDDFKKTLIIGITQSRNADEMNKTHKKFGYVPLNINILKSTEALDSIEFVSKYSQTVFQMTESSAYFEAYKHVLRKIQEMDSWIPLPLERYYVKGKSDPIMPQYIEYILQDSKAEFLQDIRELKLDESQNRALKSAFSNDMCLIQGPPGTGKTYIGVQIVKLLMKYKDYWKHLGPILLVTYTNHALNQFLYYIKDFTKRIVRLGGGKKEEGLEDFSLFEQLKLYGDKRTKGYYNLKDRISACEIRVSLQKNLLAKYQLGLINTLIAQSESLFCDQIIYQLKQSFPIFQRRALERFRKDKAFVMYAEHHIKNLRQESYQNILVLFWLEIIDLHKLLNNLYQWFQQDAFGLQQREDEKTQLLQQQQTEQKDDERDIYIEQDERERDYKKLQQKNDQKLDQLWDILNQQFSSNTVSDNMQGCESISDCIQQMSVISFQYLPGFEENQFIQDQLHKNLYIEVNQIGRWQINNYLIKGLQKQVTDLINVNIKNYERAYKEKEELDAMAAQSLFKKTEIMSMTTTGRAKYNKLLETVNFPIVIVEEAAEVFEAHILTSLSKWTDHLILIGDHEQLRPNPAQFDLSIKFNLSMSMFERLIHNDVQHTTLDEQRRMRPEISKMMKFIYPNLKDHECVTKFKDIKGLMSNLYFFDHQWEENTNDLMQSKLNIKEAEIIVRFTWYLLQQKYKAKQITILTLYAGQLMKIKQLIRDNDLFAPYSRDLRVVNVDNYQGEENDIIILSLVRSNIENKIGFLKITNRVCVALSRAKQGLFIFGNSKCLLGSQLELWADVVDYLKGNNYFGESLQFKCVNHNIVAEVKTVEDFQKVPEGGCVKPCALRMQCGHVCPSLCHPYEKTDEDPSGHNSTKCIQACTRPRDCGHNCTYKCFQCKVEHQPCNVTLQKKMSPCDHIMEVWCDKYQSTNQCKNPCEKILPCKHKCRYSCYVDCLSKRCAENVLVTHPACGHEIEKQCHEDLKTIKCPKFCDQLLPCGHPCPGKCTDCTANGLHAQCIKKCKRPIVCGHECSFPCTKNCPPCSEQRCKTQCPHSKCPKDCKDVCDLCREPCDNQCQHSQCTRFCSEPCDRQPCMEPCVKLLDCKHPCIGLCGEECPKICRICEPGHDTFQIFFGEESDPEARFVQIDCGHIFEVNGLDQFMDTQVSDAVKYRECPRCKQLIMKCRRYMNQINTVLNDINHIKGIILEREKTFQESFKQIQDKIALSIDRNKKEVSDVQMKLLLERMLKKEQLKLKQVENTRSSELLNEIVSTVNNYLDNILEMALIYCSGLINDEDRKAIKNQMIKVDAYSKSQQYNAVVIRQINLFTQELKSRANFKDQSEKIAQAVGLDKGHWNKCPNGHYYLIGECGGAMQESKCPDCKSVIGGAGHQLAAGNQFASELGGQSAWNPNGFNAQVAAGNINLQDIVHD